MINLSFYDKLSNIQNLKKCVNKLIKCVELFTLRCDHVYGCVGIITSTETGTSEDHYDGMLTF